MGDLEEKLKTNRHHFRHFCRRKNVMKKLYHPLLLKYRDRLKSMQILLSRTQAGPGRIGKQEQEQTSRNHVQAL